MSACNQYICITAASLECYRELGTGLALTAAISIPRSASADRSSHEESLRQFGAHLDRFLHDRYFVITDTQAEAYQAETVPTLSRKDLKLLLTRKLEQRYRTTSYRALVPHRSRPYAFLRNLTRRRSRTTTRILYALINPEALAPWLDALEGRALNVRGLFSLGALMPALMKHLKLPAASDALVVLRTAAGYRHAFVSPSGLRFSRLCAYSNAGDTQVGQEIDKTLQYLTMTRLWGVQSRYRTLQIVVIDAQPSAVPITIPGNNLRTVQLVQVQPRELVKRAPAPLLESANSSWLLFNHAALREHGFGCAAGTALLDASRRADYRRAALCGTVAAAAVGMGYLSFTEIATRANNELASTAELIADHVNVTAENTESTAPKTDLEPQQLRAVVQTRDRLLARSVNAVGLMQRTAAALAPFPNLDVDLLEWSYAVPTAVGAGEAAASPPDGSAVVSSDTIVLRVAGHSRVDILKSDANAAVNALAAALAHELMGKQNIEKLPFDIAPGGTLAASPKDVANAKTDFSVIVTIPFVPKHTS
ncbi:MAG: hypothetical protein QOK23_3180 [Gammaproteobacteria bacterium]|jgi:hypothetical protein|nr:hypothetical protein [Gammaproteobacteria bacterium]